MNCTEILQELKFFYSSFLSALPISAPVKVYFIRAPVKVRHASYDTPHSVHEVRVKGHDNSHLPEESDSLLGPILRESKKVCINVCAMFSTVRIVCITVT